MQFELLLIPATTSIPYHKLGSSSLPDSLEPVKHDQNQEACCRNHVSNIATRLSEGKHMTSVVAANYTKIKYSCFSGDRRCILNIFHLGLINRSVRNQLIEDQTINGTHPKAEGFDYEITIPDNPPDQQIP